MPYGRTTSVKVSVQITDVNDNAPIITGSTNISIIENLPYGTMITTVFATDSDKVNFDNTSCDDGVSCIVFRVLMQNLLII